MKNLFMFALLLFIFALQSGVSAEDKAKSAPECTTCHADLAGKKVVHAALQMGCVTCHTGIDATEIPHKNTGKIKKGLSSESPELCYTCHDKALFSRKKQHTALSMGCPSCHNPHSSDNTKLLTSAVPDLCYNCHDKKKFEGKVVHSPVMGGMCLSCHTPHSALSGMLLTGPVNNVCLACHPGDTMTKGLHVVAGSGIPGKHPVKDVEDPKRPGRELTCASCHKPHSSEWFRLFRYQAQSGVDACQQCHDK